MESLNVFKGKDGVKMIIKSIMTDEDRKSIRGK